MGCNRLCTAEDREAAELARAKGISFREAKRHIIAEKTRAAFEHLAVAQQKEAVEQIMRAREAAQKAAGYAVTMINRTQLGMTNNQKGDFGEGATAIDMFSRGYEPIAFGGQGDTGIDSIWLSPEGRYVVVESKYNKSKFGYAKATLFDKAPAGFSQPDRIRQDSVDWSMERIGPILGGASSTLYKEIMLNGYDYAVSRSVRDGSTKTNVRRTDYAT